MNISFVLLAVLLCAISIAHSRDNCVSKANCGSCIQTPKCAWCMQPDFGDQSRCFDPELHHSCLDEFTVDPGNEQYLIKAHAVSRNGETLSGDGHESGEGEQSEPAGNVQMSPQHVSLQLRINTKHTLAFNYAQTEDFPVDVYYLMDLSKSTEQDKEKHLILGNLLAESIGNITSNFRLGFGSLVDKKQACDGCETTFGFTNHMKLSTNSKQFANNVRNAHLPDNLDAPEGGLDAIMQAIVCKSDIGWREEARRLLVFSTDAGFHYAGDFAAVTPNDGECHMSSNAYTHATAQNSPRIPQINLKVNENAINIIFAVPQSQHENYKNLSNQLDGSTTAVLSEDPSSVVELIRYEYSKMSSMVEMKDTATGSVEVTYYSKCWGYNRVETNKCYGLKVGDVMEFEAEIVVTSCPADPKDRKQTFQIHPAGVSQALIVDLEMQCSCHCESSGPTFELQSPRCNGKGTLSCGVCECPDEYFGRHCECNNIDFVGSRECRDNVTDVLCSGRGQCVCGQCECNARANADEVITGRFCECDNFSCNRHDSLLCSGPDQGVCDCGSCRCREGYIGSACECSTSIDSCKADSGEICSGHGLCVCGKCKCKPVDGVLYSGEHCERCVTCPSL